MRLLRKFLEGRTGGPWAPRPPLKLPSQLPTPVARASCPCLDGQEARPTVLRYGVRERVWERGQGAATPVARAFSPWEPPSPNH